MWPMKFTNIIYSYSSFKVICFCVIRKPFRAFIVKRAVQSVKCTLRWIGRWAFKFIQGHPYWCQQKSRTGCCRNVQQCRDYFGNLRRYCIGKNCTFVDVNHPTPVWRQQSEEHCRIFRTSVHHVRKKADSFLWITLTNVYSFVTFCMNRNRPEAWFY